MVEFANNEIPTSEHYAIQEIKIYGSYESHFLEIFIDLNAFKNIWKHAQSNTEKELGGILIGKAFPQREIPIVKIVAMLNARYAKEDSKSFTFTHDTWEDFACRMKSEFPNNKMVGWYHTHPNFGIFFSNLDKFVHENFYNNKTDVALVIDPIAMNYGFFQWEGKSLIRTPSFKIFTIKENASEITNFLSQIKAEQERRKSLSLIRGYDVYGHESPILIQEIKEIFTEGVSLLIKRFSDSFEIPIIPQIETSMIFSKKIGVEQMIRKVDKFIKDMKSHGCKKIFLRIYQENDSTQTGQKMDLWCVVEWDAEESLPLQGDAEYTPQTKALIKWCGDSRINIEPQIDIKV